MTEFKALQSARKSVGQARAEELAGNVDGALRSYYHAIELYPNAVEARLYLAQLLWSRAISPAESAQVEALLAEAVRHASSASSEPEIEAGKIAAAKQALLACQDGGREEEAASLVRAAGYAYRLSKQVLCYDDAPPGDADREQGDWRSVLAVTDSALPDGMYRHLQHLFRHGGEFWREHAYGSEKTGYFSYCHQLGPGAFPLKCP